MLSCIEVCHFLFHIQSNILCLFIASSSVPHELHSHTTHTLYFADCLVLCKKLNALEAKKEKKKSCLK